MTKQIVHKVTPDMNRDDILCTTYQMRNFYRQLGDGFFSTLDIMNYIQHHQITHWCKPGNHVLDIACGRGLMLPLLRYHAKHIGSYTGVDISAGNATFVRQRVTDGQAIELASYYPFPVVFVEGNVAEMQQYLKSQYQLLIYTSAIEHMHLSMGLASLHAARQVAVDNAILYLTCPNTPEAQDGFDTQYAAHVYEWKRSELLDGLRQSGWQVLREYGLLIDNVVLQSELERLGLLPAYETMRLFVPNEWLNPIWATLFPQHAKEIGFICKAV